MTVPKAAYWKFAPTPAPPCDACALAARCRERLEACSAFALFVHGGRGKRWRSAPREPDRATYIRLLERRGDRMHRRAMARAAPA
jgi:hypothetical protein